LLLKAKKWHFCFEDKMDEGRGKIPTAFFAFIYLKIKDIRNLDVASSCSFHNVKICMISAAVYFSTVGFIT